MVPSASAVICPVSREPDKIWIDVAGTQETQFTMNIVAKDNAVRLEQMKQVRVCWRWGWLGEDILG